MNKRFVFSLGVAVLAGMSFIHDSYAQKGGQKGKQPQEQLKPWEVDTLINPIPINRQMFADRVQNALKRLDAEDGALDQRIDLADTATGNKLTELFFTEIPKLGIHIENLDATNQVKIGYYRPLERMINSFVGRALTAENVPFFRNSIQNFKGLFDAIQTGKVSEFIHQNPDIYSMNNSELLTNYPNDRSYVFEQMGQKEPAMMIKRLPEFAQEKFADGIVASAAKVVPSQVMNYATSTSYLSSVIARNQDPLVQTIMRIANTSKDPNKVLPFLGLIYHKKMTIAQADQAIGNERNYFKALVAAELEHDTLGKHTLDREVEYRGLQLVRVVNSLHESPDPVRFASIQDYTAPELYFMIIGSQDEIYTSSFVYMAKRMIQLMGNQPGDEFLNQVNYYRFRTWIRMCAGYNMLSPFLGTMSEANKNALMKNFVANLEKGGPNDLEDAVDVADAFGSIKDPNLQNFLKKEVVSNYEKNKNNEKGLIVYGLLSTIMEGSGDSKSLTNKLSIIPPITFVPYDQLLDTNRLDKAVVIQAFFYGDEDGRMSFNSFQSNFNSAVWKKTSNKNWIKYSYSGKYPVDVYANFPGDEEKNEDVMNSDSLKAYFDRNNIEPTVVIHRGHSYHLAGSLENLNRNVKIVMLGSCGGYHNLAGVLDKAPDANIISSKQTGAMAVNEPIIRVLLDQMTKGENIDWIKSWDQLGQYFSKQNAMVRDLFSDYVPPNMNLGAIFIKAYRKMRAQADEM